MEELLKAELLQKNTHIEQLLLYEHTHAFLYHLDGLYPLKRRFFRRAENRLSVALRAESP